jgi:serine/threonine protein kinase
MFNPTLDTRLVIDDQEYTFSPHPVVPTLPWGQEGRHAIVYRLQNNGSAFALKVFRPVFRYPGLLDSANALWTYHELPGMRVCRQTVIAPGLYDDLIAEYEDLEYAMLMPWIEGYTWFDFLQNRSRVTLEESRALTESIGWVLYALELNHLAHCDLSSGNVIIDPALQQVYLVDVEDLYSPWLTPPPLVPAGTMGYQHREMSETGQWGPLGDRFAGAVLMAEMLGWAHPEVRKAAYGESYFAPDELQTDNERFELLNSVLELYHPGFAEAFAQAWRSRSLEDCPPLQTWYDLLDALPRDPVESWAPIGLAELDEGEPEGEKVDALRPSVSTPLEPDLIEPGGGPAWPGRFSRAGCRRVATAALLLLVLCCYAVFFAFEWSLLSNWIK